MAVVKITVGHSCGDDDTCKQVTVRDLMQAILAERKVLEDISNLLQPEDPKKRVSQELVGKIHELYPTLRWKR